MVYKKVPSDYGLYRAEDGSLYEIMEATNVMTPNGMNYLWDTFNNIDEAATAYGLTRVPEPVEVINEPEAPDIPPEIYEYVLKQIQEGEVKD